MKIRALINDLSLKFYLKCRRMAPYFVVGAGICLLATSPSYADGGGVNHIAGLKNDVKATFGSGSDTQYFILLAEGLAGAYGYWQTKSLPVLLGVPVLMVFTHWALR